MLRKRLGRVRDWGAGAVVDTYVLHCEFLGSSPALTKEKKGRKKEDQEE